MSMETLHEIIGCLFCVFSSGYLIVHFVHFLFALLFVYVLVLPIQHGKVLSMLSNLGIVL